MNYLNTIITSWQFLIQCFRFFQKNTDLLFFPIISIILSILCVFILFAGGLLEIHLIGSFISAHPGFSLLIFLALYFLFSFMIIYFNASLIACTIERLQGKPASIGDGLELAAKHWWPMLQWAIVSVTIGFFIRILEKSHSMIQDIIVTIFGVAWSISCHFIIPIMVFENVGPFRAIKRSFGIFGRGWKRVLSIYLFFHIAVIAMFAILYGLSALLPYDTKLIIEIGVGLALIMILFSTTLGSAFNGIVNSALYLSYAQNKDVAGFDPELLQEAFKQT